MHKGSISQYSAAPEYLWIMADNNKKNSRAEALQKELAAPLIV
ncbi:hypothetical protein [Segetibacter koreensis]|nr:hypothetical protein [Segetibacter koreensis]